MSNKNKFITQKNNKLGWFATDIKFKLLHTGCPITHGSAEAKFRADTSYDCVGEGGTKIFRRKNHQQQQL